MKNRLLLLVSVVLLAFLATSCQKEDPAISFDENLIIGKWKTGTLFERYDADKTGATWDTGEDITEAEAQPFTWSIVKDELEQIHIMQNNVTIPKVYTVTVLTATKLEYKDNYGKLYSFTKQ